MISSMIADIISGIAPSMKEEDIECVDGSFTVIEAIVEGNSPSWLVGEGHIVWVSAVSRWD